MTGEQFAFAIKKRFAPIVTLFTGQGGTGSLTDCMEALPGPIEFLAACEPVVGLDFFACGSEDDEVVAARFFRLGSGSVALLGCSCVCNSDGGAGLSDDGVAAARFFVLGSGPIAFLGCS